MVVVVMGGRAEEMRETRCEMVTNKTSIAPTSYKSHFDLSVP